MIFSFTWVVVILFLLMILSFFFAASRSRISSKATDRMSGSVVSTIPTLSIWGKTLLVPLYASSSIFSPYSSSLYLLILLRKLLEIFWLPPRWVINPSHTNLLVIKSTAALDGAQIMIFLLSSSPVKIFFKYSYSAASSPISVVVFPVPGGPCKRTIPDYLNTISLIDWNWV